MFKRTKLSMAAVCVVSGVALPPQTLLAQQQSQRVEVTGSSLKRINFETAAPVQILARDENKATGGNTVGQVLDTITATSSTELRDDGASTCFASGATGVSMRGLGKGATPCC